VQESASPLLKVCGMSERGYVVGAYVAGFCLNFSITCCFFLAHVVCFRL